VVDRAAVNELILAAAVVAGAFLLGSIPTGLLLARLRGVDIRSVGSGNIGATNVARNLGKKSGVIVLVLDALKGAIPAAVVLLLDLGARVDPFVVTATGFAAVAGHCFTPWLRFRGGKGVATSLGVFLVLEPVVTAMAGGVFAGLYAATRIVSIGSITAALAYPILLWILGRPDESVALGIAVTILIVAKHHGNIRRLLRRQENKI
jgi:glycerol-3-phosphate acyltransferase PlsY